MSIRPVLLFDVMDTLVYNPFNQEIPDFFGLTQDELVRQKDPSAWPDFELGHIGEDEYYRCYFRDRRSFDVAAFRQTVAAAYRWVDQAESLLQELNRHDAEIHALSNYPIWYQTIEGRLGLSRYLRWTFVSCLTGVRKPAREAFLRAAQKLDRLPSACLFVDDSLENCQAAAAVGMSTIHFQNVPQLVAELQRSGVLPSP